MVEPQPSKLAMPVRSRSPARLGPQVSDHDFFSDFSARLRIRTPAGVRPLAGALPQRRRQTVGCAPDPCNQSRGDSPSRGATHRQGRGVWVDPAVGQAPSGEYAATWMRLREIRPVLVLLGAWSGLRWGELIGLTRSSIDLLQGTVTVSQATVELGSSAYVGPPKSDAGRRTVRIPPHLIPEVEWHLEKYVPRAPDAMVFTGPRGGTVRRNNFHQTWHRARLAAQVSQIDSTPDVLGASVVMPTSLAGPTQRRRHQRPRPPSRPLHQPAQQGRWQRSIMTP